jgi:hypothetical protein
MIFGAHEEWIAIAQHSASDCAVMHRAEVGRRARSAFAVAGTEEMRVKKFPADIAASNRRTIFQK